MSIACVGVAFFNANCIHAAIALSKNCYIVDCQFYQVPSKTALQALRYVIFSALYALLAINFFC